MSSGCSAWPWSAACSQRPGRCPLSWLRAQQALSFPPLSKSRFWPEFDKPSTLVILNGQVTAGDALPAELSIRIPAAAGAPSAVALVGADGGLFQTQYTTSQAGGGYKSPKFTTNSVGFRVEYYDPALLISGDALLLCLSLEERCRDPGGDRAGARALRCAEAEPGQTALTSDGVGRVRPDLLHGLARVADSRRHGIIQPGLRQTGNALSATAVANTHGGASSPASTQGAPAANGTNSSQPWIVGAAVAGLVVTGGVVAWYLRFAPATQGQVGRRRTTSQGRRGTAQPARAAQNSKRSASARAGATASAAASKAPAAFCPQCGQRYQRETGFAANAARR